MLLLGSPAESSLGRMLQKVQPVYTAEESFLAVVAGWMTRRARNQTGGVPRGSTGKSGCDHSNRTEELGSSWTLEIIPAPSPWFYHVIGLQFCPFKAHSLQGRGLLAYQSLSWARPWSCWVACLGLLLRPVRAIRCQKCF